MAIAGALSLIRDDRRKPVPPQNIIGDYASGGSLAVSAILAALIQRGKTGEGQHLVISMCDGIRYLMTDTAAATISAGHAEDSWRRTLNGGMPTYAVYATADRRWMAVAALEPKFLAILAEALDWPELVALMANKSTWPEAERGLEERFRTKTMAAWWALFKPLDACVTPVRRLDEIDARNWPSLPNVAGCL